ncbi:guanine nucleotide-binding protein-like 3-like protein isoform X2 [Rhea pennata]|uniref:guanine nucleotide-binding protein-like 3-like protein isoform X2 n=1 Tax=Rhea pennata TaxID=8795 RepID=UPI002E26DE99
MAGRRQCRQTAAGRRRGQGPGAAKKERAAPRLRGRQSEAGAARAAELLRRRPGLARLRDDALRRQRAFERKAAEGAEPDEPRPRGEASLRRYGRELRKVLAASDVVLEVLDARDPQGCRSPRLEAAVRRAGPCKRLVLVLNKIDLVSRDVVAKWLKFLRAEFPTVAFKACTQQQSRNLKQSRGAVATVPEEVLAGAGCVGADCLLQVLANYSRSQDVKTAITVGVVGECWGEGFADAWALPLKPSPRRPTGFPNVGKSSLINSLKRSRACRVGAQPGITKCLQVVQLDRRLRLLDCPGVVAGGPGAALCGGLGTRHSADPLGPAAAILRRLRPDQVRELYGVPPCEDPRRLLALLARRQGRLRPGGLPDTRAAAAALLRDWTSGKISYYTVPPEAPAAPTTLDACILPALAPALDLEALEQGDAEALAALPAVAGGVGLAPCTLEEEEASGAEDECEEEAMEDDGSNLEFAAVTVELKPRPKAAAAAPVRPPATPRLEDVAALDPLLQGQALQAAGKRRRKLQRRAEKLATKLSETLTAAMQF